MDRRRAAVARRMRGLLRGPLALAAAGAIAAAPVSAASHQEAGPRYRIDQVQCAVYRQAVVNRISSSRQGQRARATTGWDGDLAVHGVADSLGAVNIEAWFERLRVWQETPDGAAGPATDGLIGGRYRGVLDSLGGYRSRAVPFVPDAIAAIADLRLVLDELLPPLPQDLPAPGGEASDASGWSWDRLSDTVWRGRSALRFRMHHHDTTDVVAEWRESRKISATSMEEERGRLVWVPALGPVGWTRTIVTQVEIPVPEEDGPSIHTEVRQQRTLERLLDDPDISCSAEQNSIL